MCTRFSLKIHTAFFISLAFIFRLLVVNASGISSFNTPQTNKLLTKHFSTIQKKRRQAHASAPAAGNYQAGEIYAERLTKKNNFIKADPLVLLFLLCALFKKNAGSPEPDVFASKYYLFPRKYLSFSRLRI